MKLQKHTFCEICIMSFIGVKRMHSLPQEIQHLVLSHGEDDHSQHGKQLSKRAMALMMLKSLEENDEESHIARNKLKQIDSAWIDSLKENHQTDCEEYKDFEKTLTSDTIRYALRQHYLNPSAERIHEKKKSMLRVKELEIVIKNVKMLKLFMNKYKDDPYLVKKIRFKLDSIIREYYSKGKAKIGFHEGAHPEYIMNSFIYNPWKGEMNFKILRIDGNQVTHQLYRNNYPHGNPNQIGLDAFLKIRIPLKPIGEVYNFFPDREDNDRDAPYDDKVNYYLERLMKTFAKKPDTEFFSVPEAAVPASPVSGAAASSDAGGSRKNMKSTRKQRMYKKSRKCRKSRKH